jgi:hypothetical protein
MFCAAQRLMKRLSEKRCGGRSLFPEPSRKVNKLRAQGQQGVIGRAIGEKRSAFGGSAGSRRMRDVQSLKQQDLDG